MAIEVSREKCMMFSENCAFITKNGVRKRRKRKMSRIHRF